MKIKHFASLAMLLLGLCAAAVAPANAQLPLAQPALTLDVGGGASVLARQPDGKVIAGGSFTKVNGSARANLARFNADGTLDATFNASINGEVSHVVISGSSIYVAGNFTRVSGVARTRLAKLTMTDGSLDSTFNAAVSGSIKSVAVDAGGNVYAAGAMTAIGGVTGRTLVKLNGATGAADSEWNPSFPETLTAISTIASNGEYLYVVGYRATDLAYQIGRAHRLLRSTGAVDTTWAPPHARLTNEGDAQIGFDSAGNVFVAGSGGYTAIAYGPEQLLTITIEKFLGSSGAVDPAWVVPTTGTFFLSADGADLYTSGEAPRLEALFGNSILKRNAATGAAVGGWSIPSVAQGNVTSVAVSPEGLWVGGNLSFVNGVRASGIARLNTSTGALQTAFAANVTIPGAGGSVVALPDGKMLVGGRFDFVNGLPRSNLARINTDATFDPTWTAGTDGDVWRLAVLGNHVYAVGFFTLSVGTARTGVARFDASTGLIDAGWNANLNGAARRIAFDGTDVFVTGGFSSVGGLPRNAVAKVSGVNGTVISAFSAPYTRTTCGTGTVGLAYAAGFVYATIPYGCISPVDTSRLLGRFSSTTGAYDASWTPAPSSTVRDIVISGDNLYAAGVFATVGGVAKRLLAKISLSSGTVDAAWGNSPTARDFLYSVAIAGQFLYTGGVSRNPVDGGSEPIIERHVLATGLRDTGWNPYLTRIAPNISVGHSSFASSATGDRIFAAANFSAVSDQPRDGFAAFTVNQLPLSAPTAVTLMPGNGQLLVAFTAPANDGGSTISGYTATCTPSVGVATAVTGLASPVTVAGLTNGVAYTCRVYATNGIGAGVGPESAASSAVSPALTSLPALIVTTSGTGQGTVSSTPADMTCPGTCVSTHAAGTSVTLTATASSGSSFTGWLGACSGTGACNVSINGVTRVGATFAPNVVLPLRIDLDNTSTYSALTDGMLIARYLAGNTGSALTGGATLVDSAQVGRRLNNLRPIFDIDGNGQVDAATDGVLLMRYLFGLRGAALATGVIGGGATRTMPSDIEVYIQSITP